MTGGLIRALDYIRETHGVTRTGIQRDERVRGCRIVSRVTIFNLISPCVSLRRVPFGRSE